MDQRVLEEIAGRDHRLELVGGDEVVVLGMALARPRLARGERDRQAQARIARQHRVDDARLAGARGRGDDEQGSGHDSASFDVLHLLADLVDQHLQLHRRVGGARVDRLVAERVRLRLNSCSRKSRRRPTGSAARARGAVRRGGCRGGRALVHVQLLQPDHQPCSSRPGSSAEPTRPAAFPASAAGRRGFAAPARAPRRRCRRWRRRVRKSRSPASRPRVRARRRNRRAPRRARPAPRPVWASDRPRATAARRELQQLREIHAHAGKRPSTRRARSPRRSTTASSTCSASPVRSCAGAWPGRPCRATAARRCVRATRVRTRAIRRAGARRPRGSDG